MRFSLIVLLLAILAPGSGVAETGGLSNTWDKAEIWVRPADGGFISSHMDDKILRQRLAGSAKKYPTVLFFHDCGKNRKLAGWHYARFLARAGFAVILPDSFARRERPETCTYWQFKPLANAPAKQVHTLRRQEITHALEKIKTLSWVDGKNLFIMGHGEGGDALAAFEGGGYRARVISGALCPWGVQGPKDIPVLAVASRDDRLFKGAPADSCAKQAGGRPFNTVLFDGYQHDTSSLPEARQTVIEFLKTLVK